MSDLFKKPITVIIIIVAIFIAMGWSYYSNYTEKKKAQTQEAEQLDSTQMINLATIDPKDFDEVIKTELATANSEALKSNSGNRLVAIEVLLPSLQLSTGTTRYIFSSPTNTVENWTMTFSNETRTSLRAKIPKEDYMGDVAEMNTSLWKFNYVTAIQIMEKNGGKEWRQNNGLSSIKATLRHGGENNWLLWYMEYKSGDTMFTKALDANSGKVIE